MFNWSRNKETIVVENFMLSGVHATGTKFFVASFVLDEKPQASIVYCTMDHLKQLAALAGRHYAGIRFHNRLWATHLETHDREIFMSNAILYLRKSKLARRHRELSETAFVLDFLIDSSNNENDKVWLETETTLTPINLAEKYNEYLRFLELTEEEGVARHCAGLEDVHLYHSAYVAYLAQEDDAETEEVLEDVEE